MSNKVKSRSRLFRLLERSLIIIGCAIFLFSVFSPYLHFTHFGFTYSSSFFADIWSFKVTFHYVRDFEGFYIFDYVPLPELPWINIMILIAQILVLATGIASLFINKKILAFTPSVFCLAVIMLMLYVSIRIGHSFFERGYSNYSNSLQAGFYITLFSLPFYLVAFIADLASTRRSKLIQETNTAITEAKKRARFSVMYSKPCSIARALEI